MSMQKRLLKFIVRANWILLLMAAIVGYFATSLDFTVGIIAGGLIVTINFHLLYRTLKRSLRPSHLVSPKVVIVKYYIRFTISALIIIFLITGKFVNPLGLFIGLSVVVASIFLATLCEINKQICKEAV
ncbi:MAG: ATP synthase subunit I [Dissulfuribacterales bacterium]